MKYYKVISKDGMAKDGGVFDYKPYYPKGSKAGKWTPQRKTNICNSGYHVTPYFNMWLNDSSNLVFEVDVKGLVEDRTVGVVDKFVCESIRLVKQLSLVFDNNANTGNWNTGYGNTGDGNTGDGNTGDGNTGNKNTGNKNTGNKNTGNKNTGDRNTGYENTGDRNTGYENTGNKNTGNKNTGYENTGDENTGNRNTGDRNTGNWNNGNKNTGCFNTKEPDYYELFNKPISKEDYNKVRFPSWLYFDLENDYKASFKKAFMKASVKDVRATINLPNFDYEVFKEISGISKVMINEKLKKKR